MPSSSTNEWAKAEKEIAQDQQLQAKITNEEFKIWKKTVPLLYDFIHTFALDHPSTIVRWLPKYQLVDNDTNVEVQLLLSSNTINSPENSLELASVTLPSTLVGKEGNGVLPADGIDTSNFKRLTKWKQNSVTNALKLSPDGSIALSFNGDGIIRGCNLTSDKVVDYKYHKQPGFALEWISNNNEKFLSGANDSQIALWQLEKPSTPIQLFKSHHGAINDISTSNANIFGSVSDDSTTQFHDLRVASVGDINPVIKQENKFIQNCIQFHPQINTFYATGGKDNVVSLYDLRNYKIPFRKLFGHNASIRQLEWDTFNPLTLVSCGLDSRILFWNLDNLEEDYTYPETSATANSETSKRKTQQSSKPDPCLKYVHGGHVGRINDFTIHPKIPNLFASVGDDRLLEIWEPKTLLVEEEDEEEEEEQAQEKEQEQEEEQEEAEGEERKEEESEQRKEDEKGEEKEKEKSSEVEVEAGAGKSSKDDDNDASLSKDVEMKD